MIAGFGRLIGGYAFSRRDLRLLYAAVFLSFLGASVTFPLRMLYAQAHHASPTELGIMAGAFLVAPLVAQLPMGWLVDTWGRVPVLLVGLVVHPILSILYIFFASPVDLIVLRFLEGVTVAAFQPAISAYIADVTPEEHRSEAFGALGATLNAGLLIGPFIGGIVGEYFGFTAAFVANFVIEVVAVPLVLGHVHEPNVHRAETQVVRSGWRALFSLSLSAVYVSYFSTQVVMGMLGSLWAVFVHDLGGSYAYIGITFTVFALPQILFGATAGRLADRFGRAPFLLISGVLAGLIYASYGFISSLIAIAVVGLLEGVVLVFQQPVMQGLLADASPEDSRGRAQGLAGSAGAVGGSISAFASFPLYHMNRITPFVAAGCIMGAGALVSAGGATAFSRRRRAQAAITEAA